jgi:hypothetical protein
MNARSSAVEYPESFSPVGLDRYVSRRPIPAALAFMVRTNAEMEPDTWYASATAASLADVISIA